MNYLLVSRKLERNKRIFDIFDKMTLDFRFVSSITYI